MNADDADRNDNDEFVLIYGYLASLFPDLPSLTVGLLTLLPERCESARVVRAELVDRADQLCPPWKIYFRNRHNLRILGLR